MGVLIKGITLDDFKYDRVLINYKGEFLVKNMDCEWVAAELQEVPMPHGRLVDADKLAKEYTDNCKDEELQAALALSLVLKNAPTVVEEE